ncbi:MAG TPA: efflux RND transporter periplasmic adaptor subunit, partial [Blastocatellia bacterium]|nr:efflux RND transporter periplasmic adaptor subunit [Blastocatellia bacterium]
MTEEITPHEAKQIDESGGDESKQPGSQSPRTRSTGSRVFRITIAVLALALLALGYWQREAVVRILTARANNGPAAAERKVLYWVDPMHPQYKSDKPGTAPDCGMDLVPVYADGDQPAANMPAGAFKITPEKQQLIGVQYGEAAYEEVSKTLRTVGKVTYDETRVEHAHTKVEGWIEEVYVDFTGKLVKEGEPLLSIYSPELLQTQQEFLIALRGRRELGESPFKEASASADSLYQAARRRLELWDITEEQIKELERTGKPVKAITLYSHSTGIVLTRNAYHKQRINLDTELYSIADLSSVWVLADVYEYEASEVSIGQPTTITLPYIPGRVFRGKVTYINPQIDPTTRTLKVRIEVANPKLELKPDMFANVELKVGFGRRVVVPQEAVMDSGSEKTVFVAVGDGYFQPRNVETGPIVNGRAIIIRGLKAGEKVVTSANFLIDSESRLRSATGGMGMPGMSHGAPPKES